MLEKDCKFLFREMSERYDRNERTTLEEVIPSLISEGRKYRRVFFIILDEYGKNINMRHLEKLGLVLYAGEAKEDYLLYYHREPVLLDCPPSHRNIVKRLYDCNKLNLMLYLYALFAKMCCTIRASEAAYKAACEASEVAYEASYEASQAAYEAAYEASYEASQAAYEASYEVSYEAYEASYEASYEAYEAYEASYEASQAAKIHSRAAFRSLIKLRKLLLEGRK